ncbi:hypothetical protein A4H97_20135 [Niastella yeongjuensis]|uniref:Phage tail collar domain-containing protein n=1 Tax=Niastella yeongjuensis TaxID=354355 RepID=A0A1V9FCA4_9BACT|nr:tail fiber protein [Niastella yeongjuensis]OQP55902.1 hypothetical protein A4H97_20135 [Niastella yeongjuensis]SEP27359.1 Microcystin-dependent protein [Niastella yeongjuensis]
MDGYVGEIRLFAADFEPQGWAFCHGQFLAVSQYLELFSVIGNTYGGDAITTFALPDYRGRAPIGFGSGNSLSTYTLGQQTGTTTNTLTTDQLPAHTHQIIGSIAASASTQAPDSDSPMGNYFASGDGTAKFDSQHDGVTMNYNITLNNSGNNTPLDNRMPFQAIHYIICLSGIIATT